VAGRRARREATLTEGIDMNGHPVVPWELGRNRGMSTRNRQPREQYRCPDHQAIGDSHRNIGNPERGRA
jgi:hypothetical protein